MKKIVLCLILMTLGNSIETQQLDYGTDYLINCQNNRKSFSYYSRKINDNEKFSFVDIISTEPSAVSAYILKNIDDDLKSAENLLMPFFFDRECFFVISVACDQESSIIQFRVFEFHQESNTYTKNIDERPYEAQIQFSTQNSQHLNEPIFYISLSLVVIIIFGLIFWLGMSIEHNLTERNSTKLQTLEDIVVENEEPYYEESENIEEKITKPELESPDNLLMKYDCCTICLENKFLVKFFPCEHSNACKACAIKVADVDPRCPICRQSIHSFYFDSDYFFLT